MGVSKQELVSGLAEKVRPMIRRPDWADFVKTGVSKEKPPRNPDWWYQRAASILLKVERLQPIGVSKLRTKYGAKKNNGVAPEHFYKGSGKIIRLILQELETAGLLKQQSKALHKGRVITQKAQSLIANTIKELEKPRAKPKVASEKTASEKPASEKSASEKLADPENKSFLKLAEAKEPVKEEASPPVEEKK